MSLPSPWVEKIFAKLTLCYGRDFLGRWEGLDIAAVKDDWAHELSGFQQHPQAIAYALEHLPAKPPTVLEFRAACNLRREDALALPAPAGRADPYRIAQELAKLHQKPVRDPKDWARAILRRVEGGEKLPPISIRFAKEALRAA